MSRRWPNWRTRRPGGGSLLPSENETTAQSSQRPTADVDAGLISQCAGRVRLPSTRELNFDDVERQPHPSRVEPHYQTRELLNALLEPPEALADFLLDPSLLPKRPPTAARAS